jgi:hypothetical protein
VSKPTKASSAIAGFVAGYRDRHGLEPQAEFFIPFWRRLPDDIDTSPWWGSAHIAGWNFTAEDRVAPVRR